MQYRFLNNLIQAQIEQIKNIRSIANTVPTDKVLDLEDTLVENIEKLAALQIDILSKVYQLGNYDYKLLLTLRYLNFRTWEQIAEEMNLTFQWAHVIHNRALKAFDPLIERGEQIESKH